MDRIAGVWASKKSAALVALLVSLALIVSGAPLSQADPNQPGDGSTISEIEPLDDAAEPEELPADDLGDGPADDFADDATQALGVGWSEESVEARAPSPSGYIKPSIDTKGINNGVYRPGLNRAGILPTSYDMRLAAPLELTPVRDQGSWGTCWAFAAGASAMSTLVRNGNLTGYEPVDEKQLSPLHLVQGVYYTDTFKANTWSPLAWNGPYQLGGNDFMAAAAWSHWYGPQKEADYPYPSNQAVAPGVLESNEIRSGVYKLRNMYVLPAPRDFWGDFRADNVYAIKKAVYEFGAASTAFSAYNLGSDEYYDSTHKSFYDDSWDWADHAVTIIGWDDNFSRDKFVKRPNGNGAFLIMNSWGEGEENRDYFWLSYYDTTMETSAIFVMAPEVASDNHRDPWEWTSQYAYDHLGIGGYIFNNTRTISYANRFTVKEGATLRAVQIGTLQPDMSYKVQVYTGNIKSTSATAGGSAKPVTALGAKSVTGVFEYAGYNTVLLSRPVVLKKGQKLSIVVTLTAPKGDIALATVEEKDDFGAGDSTMSFSAGQSFIKHGGKWRDMKAVYKQLKVTGYLGNFNVIGLVSEAPVFALNYEPNGGTVATPDKSVTFGTKLGTLAKPTRTGYTFTGWYSKAVGGKKYTSKSVYTWSDDMSVFAHWKAKKYTVKFNADGGATPKRSGKAVKSKSVTFAKTYGALPTTKRTGYTFAGWWTAKEGGTQVTSASVMDTAAGHTLYARWVPKTYTVNFDPRAGTVSPMSKAVTYGATYGDLPVPDQPGYDFQGWYTKTAGGSLVTADTTVKITGTQTLYARWVLI